MEPIRNDGFYADSNLWFLDVVKREMAYAQSRADSSGLSPRSPDSAPISSVFSELIGNSGNVMEDDRIRIKEIIKLGAMVANKLELSATYARLERLSSALNREPFYFSSLANELKVLNEAADDELKHRYFFYYPIDKARKVNTFVMEWSDSNDKFASARESALNATDCYALGKSDACVFHCMQVLESGLRVLAKNVGLTFDTQQWQNVINEIESRITSMR
jgi:hypothetical protein